QLAVDGQRPAPAWRPSAVAGVLVEIALLGPVRLGALPPGRFVVRTKRFHGVEARSDTTPAEATLRLGHLDVRLGQVVEKPRGPGGLPQAVHAPVRGEENLHPPSRPRDADVSEAAFLLEAGAALIVERALVGKQAFFPAGQEHGVELESLGRVQ